MTNKKLIKVLQGVLKTEESLDFLLELKGKDIEKLVTVTREKVEGYISDCS